MTIAIAIPIGISTRALGSLGFPSIGRSGPCAVQAKRSRVQDPSAGALDAGESEPLTSHRRLSYWWLPARPRVRPGRGQRACEERRIASVEAAGLPWRMRRGRPAG